MVRIFPVSHRERSTAEAIHAVMVLAYTQEARLLHVEDFRPLARTIEDIEASGDFHFGAMLEEDVVGVLCVGPDDEPDQLCITSLVVHPRVQRQGVGRMLVEEALSRGKNAVFSVVTAAQNAPAIALYEQLGFVAYRQGVIGPNDLPLLKLRRAA